MTDIVGSASVSIEADGSNLASSLAESLQAEVVPALESVVSMLSQVDALLGTADSSAQTLASTLEAVEPPDLTADLGLDQIAADAQEVAAAVSAVGDELDGLTGTDVTIEADASQVEEAAEAVAALDGESVQVSVEALGADEVAASLANVGTQAQGAASGLTSSAAAGATFGEILGSVGSRLPGPVAGLTAFAAAGAALGNAAIEAEGSIQAFNLRVGEFADEIRNVDVGGLNEDIGTLAIRLGSSDEGLQDAAARIFALGEASGVAGPEVAATTEQIVALGARAVALNPQLGDVGAVTERLTNALSRGGRFLAAYGVSLTTAEITTRALSDTGKEAAADLTVFERATAGAALASEQFGTTLADDVNAGAENTSIRLRSLTEQLGEAVEAAGQPVVAPLLEIMEDALPSIGSALEIVGAGFTALQPILSGVFAVAEPILNLFAEGLPLAIGAVIDMGRRVGEVFDLALGPIDEVIASIGGAIGDLTAVEESNFDLAESAVAASAALGGENVSLEDLTATLADAQLAFGRYIFTNSRFAEAGDDVILAVQRISGGVAELQTALEEGDEGFKDFVASGIAAGDIDIEIGGVQQTAEQVANLEGNLSGLLESGQAVVTQGEEVTRAFNEEQRAAEAAAQAELEFLVFTGELTEAQRDAAIAIANTTGETGSYQEALRLVAEGTEDLTEQTKEAVGATDSFFGALSNLADQVEDAAIADNLEQQSADGIEALNSLASAALTQSQIITGALQDLNEDGSVSLYEFTTSLQTQAAEQAKFAQDLRNLQERGADDLVLSILAAGEQGAALASEAALLNDQQLADQEQFVDDQFALAEAANLGIAVTQAEAVVNAQQTADDVTAAGRSSDFKGGLHDDFLAAAIQAKLDGEAVADATTEGMRDGFTSHKFEVKSIVTAVAEDIKTTFENVLEIFSPSKVFEGYGENIAAGLVLGIDSGDSDATASASRLADAAAVGTTATVGSGGGVNLQVGQIVVSMPQGATQADGVAFGEAISEGMLRKFEREIQVG